MIDYNIHSGQLKHVLACFNEVGRHISAPLHCYYTAEVVSDLANLGDCRVEMMP